MRGFCGEPGLRMAAKLNSIPIRSADFSTFCPHLMSVVFDSSRTFENEFICKCFMLRVYRYGYKWLPEKLTAIKLRISSQLQFCSFRFYVTNVPVQDKTRLWSFAKWHKKHILNFRITNRKDKATQLHSISQQCKWTGNKNVLMQNVCLVGYQPIS